MPPNPMSIKYMLNPPERDASDYQPGSVVAYSYRGVESSCGPLPARSSITERNMEKPGCLALCYCPWCQGRWFKDDEIDAHIEHHLQKANQAIWLGDGKDHSITITKVVSHLMMCVEHPPPYFCTYQDGTLCGTFQQKRELMDHIYHVHCPKAFRCPWRPCEGPHSIHFDYKELKEHVRNYHLFPIWYMCRDCHMVVRNQTGLVPHEWHRRHREVECVHPTGAGSA
ncbi:hypothetical protein BDV26DRAFT_290449 [Aspergillus bertholletiae]|uniref:C2H2-type domain-containing protein n=1 Tax=Aspergillus bertholletiae TaxID=1226010 RepID=A0A5N7BEZ5_9EURO|nr:hypothetical protein BDV26DRAFT_290449 [Aspergillus bertholletiae]